VGAVLDALKWNKAVLVGCDRDAVLAIEAALRLAPERIAGLVLCGDLSYVEEHIGKLILAMQQSEDFDDEEDLSIDSFLRDYLDCPCTIIWEGDASGGVAPNTMPTTSDRKTIIGGGLAPHRQLPEQFAWTLSRFVENQVSERSPLNDFELSLLHGGRQPDGGRVKFRGGSTMMVQDKISRPRTKWQEIVPPEIEQMIGSIFSSGSLLVSGRAIASAIIYVSLAKVGLCQYKNVRNIHSSYLYFSSWENNLGRLGSLLGNFSRRLFTISLPVVISRRGSRRIKNPPNSDSCESEDTTTDGSEQNIDETCPLTDDDVPRTPDLGSIEGESPLIDFDGKRRYDTEMKRQRYHNLFTALDQVIS